MIEKSIKEEERVKEVDHFIQQIRNSEYNVSQMKDIILSSIRGTQKREKKVVRN